MCCFVYIYSIQVLLLWELRCKTNVPEYCTFCFVRVIVFTAQWITVYTILLGLLGLFSSVTENIQECDVLLKLHHFHCWSLNASEFCKCEAAVKVAICAWLLESMPILSVKKLSKSVFASRILIVPNCVPGWLFQSRKLCKVNITLMW